MCNDLRSDLVLSTILRATSNTVSKPRADHAERRFSMLPLAVQSCGSVRLVLPERDHLLVVGPRSSEVSSVLLYAMERRRSILPGRGQADLSMVSGVGQQTLWHKVRWQLVPDRSEHLAVVDVRARQLVGKYDESIDLDGRVRLDPVLRRFQTMIDLPPRPLAAAEAGSDRGHYRCASW